jgi:hypothetical protein
MTLASEAFSFYMEATLAIVLSIIDAWRICRQPSLGLTLAQPIAGLPLRKQMYRMTFL